MPHQDDGVPEPNGDKLGWWHTVASIASAMFGVRSSRGRVRDFGKGKLSQFIIVGIVMIAAFVTTLVLIVRLLLRNAGL